MKSSFPGMWDFVTGAKEGLLRIVGGISFTKRRKGKVCEKLEKKSLSLGILKGGVVILDKMGGERTRLPAW